MGYYTTKARLNLNPASTKAGIGEAFKHMGNSAVKFADVEEDRQKKEKEKVRLSEQAKGMRNYLTKNGMDVSKMSDDNVRDNFHIHKASIDENHKRALEDAMISVYEQKHPIFMTKKIKNKDGTLIDNPDYKNLTREQKVAMIKYAGSHQIDPKSPDIVKITADENLNQVAWFKDGSYKKTNVKAFDYNKPRNKINREVGIYSKKFDKNFKSAKELSDYSQKMVNSKKMAKFGEIKIEKNKKDLRTGSW